MKTAELTGAELDYWVAKAAGYKNVDDIPDEVIGYEYHPHEPNCRIRNPWAPSTDWAQGGPLIERERISIINSSSGEWTGMVRAVWSYDGTESDHEQEGPSPLIAAMRAYVASKFGDEVPEIAG